MKLLHVKPTGSSFSTVNHIITLDLNITKFNLSALDYYQVLLFDEDSIILILKQ